jgi:hypothetical protein
LFVLKSVGLQSNDLPSIGLQSYHHKVQAAFEGHAYDLIIIYAILHVQYDDICCVVLSGHGMDYFCVTKSCVSVSAEVDRT